MPAQPFQVESLVQAPVPADNAQLDVLVPATADHAIELNRSEKIVLLFESMGRSAIEHCTETEITEARESLRDKFAAEPFEGELFEVPNMAAVVNHAILRRILTIRENKAAAPQLTPRDYVILQIYAAGGTNGHIAEATGEKSRNKVRTWGVRLNEKLGTHRREESVRAAYEFKKFNFIKKPVSLDQILRVNQE